MAAQIQVINDPADLAAGFDNQAATFGEQTRDAIWIASNPGWNTPEGRDAGISRLLQRYTATTFDTQGRPNAVHLKATVPDEKTGGEKLIGFAIWAQQSAVPGHGDPVANAAQRLQLAQSIIPHNEAEARYLGQLCVSLYRRRGEVAEEKATSAQPSFLVLDACTVLPEYQGKGIARQLVQWGLDEAQRRGGLEATTEASSMGRRLYTKMGFTAERNGRDIVYIVDPEFEERERPPNVFLRTRPAN